MQLLMNELNFFPNQINYRLHLIEEKIFKKNFENKENNKFEILKNNKANIRFSDKNVLSFIQEEKEVDFSNSNKIYKK